MAIAYMNSGSGGSGGIRTKRITAAEYAALSEADRNNPYVVWLIVDRAATDTEGLITNKAVTKICKWDVYKNLPDDDKYDEKTIWIISDKSESDLASLGFLTENIKNSKLYSYAAELDAGAMLDSINMLINKVNEHSAMLQPVSEDFGNENLNTLLNQLVDMVNLHTSTFNRILGVLKK